MNNHVLKNLEELIIKQGKSCLLPQNLPDNILVRIQEETIALEEDSENPPPSALLIAVLELKSDGLVSLSGKLEISPEELMDNFYVYSSSIRLEILRRSGKLVISKESLPTLDNILDGNRIIDVTTTHCG